MKVIRETSKGKIDLAEGTIFEVITKEGDKHVLIVCSNIENTCLGCVCFSRYGDPLEDSLCGRVRCSSRIFKRAETLLEDL